MEINLDRGAGLRKRAIDLKKQELEGKSRRVSSLYVADENRRSVYSNPSVQNAFARFGLKVGPIHPYLEELSVLEIVERNLLMNRWDANAGKDASVGMDYLVTSVYMPGSMILCLRWTNGYNVFQKMTNDHSISLKSFITVIDRFYTNIFTCNRTKYFLAENASLREKYGLDWEREPSASNKNRIRLIHAIGAGGLREGKCFSPRVELYPPHWPSVLENDPRNNATLLKDPALGFPKLGLASAINKAFNEKNGRNLR